MSKTQFLPQRDLSLKVFLLASQLFLLCPLVLPYAVHIHYSAQGLAVNKLHVLSLCFLPLPLSFSASLTFASSLSVAQTPVSILGNNVI